MDPVTRIVESLLSRQDPTRPHTLLTRLLVSFCIGLAFIVLYGFYGLIAAIVFYLIGIELLGFPTNWLFYPLIAGVLIGCWKSSSGIRDYWGNHGYAGS